ncbi:hypothetical protein J6590_027000 [Homalodisca vitripennis]|nr:hypothetical protein J6590_027000 [Homalodisca vitripennis]
MLFSTATYGYSFTLNLNSLGQLVRQLSYVETIRNGISVLSKWRNRTWVDNSNNNDRKDIVTLLTETAAEPSSFASLFLSVGSSDWAYRLIPSPLPLFISTSVCHCHVGPRSLLINNLGVEEASSLASDTARAAGL